MVPCNQITRYEIVLAKGAESFRAGFYARRTKAALRDALFAIPLARRLEIFDSLGTDAAFAWDSKAKEWRANDGAALRFSGQTERDIKNAPGA